MSRLSPLLSATFAASLALGTLSAATVMLAPSAAHADKGGHGNGHGHGNGRGNRDRHANNGHGHGNGLALGHRNRPAVVIRRDRDDDDDRIAAAVRPLVRLVEPRLGSVVNRPNTLDDFDGFAGGDLLTMLRWLNAANAAPVALANAAPTSNVGRIDSYRDATLDTVTAADDLRDARLDYAGYVDGYGGRSSAEIRADIGTLDTRAPGYEDDLQDLIAELNDALVFEERRDALQADLRDARLTYGTADAAEEDALYAATRGQTPTDAVLAQLLSRLDF